ncbi:hypothetical protein HPP92_015020 [Vanilla planifolia]|uniref:Pentatricopeptide repeat-containing protein n=1 Tax=Vanilla planifolia TaxID=51239 RepID=A0A835QR94_VANPL|nr:hypothetical protein HPP92_015020 [Vanilla planifolia]
MIDAQMAAVLCPPSTSHRSTVRSRFLLRPPSPKADPRSCRFLRPLVRALRFRPHRSRIRRIRPLLCPVRLRCLPRRSAFSHTAMIRAHSAGPAPSNSLYIFSCMLHSGLYPDRFVFPFLLRATARCRSPVSAVHAMAARHGLDEDPHVVTSLLHSYGSCGLFDSARKVFDEKTKRTEVNWCAIISCFARSGQHSLLHDGISLFGQLISTGGRPNGDIVIAALSCCAGLGSMSQGKALHALFFRHLTDLSVELGTALINMYGRCGGLTAARRVFDEIRYKDSSTWTAMIGGLAMNGRGEEALTFFSGMVDRRFWPDSITFTAVLNACSHAGLVETGIKLFKDMKEVYGIEARMEHYGAVVDMLGRAGMFEQAGQVVASMPFAPNRVVWGSLLHACAVRGEPRYWEMLEKRFLELGLTVEQDEDEKVVVDVGFLVGLSNVYAGTCRWQKVGTVREKMVARGVKKEIAFSLLEVDGRTHRFLGRREG